MHDNAKPHTARHTVEALRQNNINVTPHPAKSPDLNQIEHFWDFLKRDMRAANVRPQNVGELRQTITQAWGMGKNSSAAPEHPGGLHDTPNSSRHRRPRGAHALLTVSGPWLM